MFELAGKTFDDCCRSLVLLRAVCTFMSGPSISSPWQSLASLEERGGFRNGC